MTTISELGFLPLGTSRVQLLFQVVSESNEGHLKAIATNPKLSN